MSFTMRTVLSPGTRTEVRLGFARHATPGTPSPVKTTFSPLSRTDAVGNSAGPAKATPTSTNGTPTNSVTAVAVARRCRGIGDIHDLPGWGARASGDAGDWLLSR
jgi:hypothetical protein